MIERIALTLGRCLLGLYFLVPGLSKITGYSGTLAYMQLHNVPLSDLLLPLTIVLQVGGGLALLSGFRIRDTALMFAGLTIAINIGMHDFWNTYPEVSSDRETQNFVKNLAIFAGLLVLSSVNSLPQFRISRS